MTLTDMTPPSPTMGSTVVELAAPQESAVRVLVVDHDEQHAKSVHHALENEGYSVEVTTDLLDSLRSFTQDPPDVVLLEVLFPTVASAEVCRRMNDLAPVPVIMCSAPDDELDLAGALELGAADYLPKPYHLPDLLARIEGVLRPFDPSRTASRARWAAVAVRGDGMTIGALHIDFAAREVKHHGRPVHLPRREFDLLATLLSPPGRLRTRAELGERLWSGRYVPGSRTLDTHIRRLRLKLEDDPARPRHIVTVRGVGFRFDIGPMSVEI
jgi:two-component system response regulator RegX3